MLVKGGKQQLGKVGRQKRRVVRGILGEFYRREMLRRFSLMPDATATFSIYVPSADADEDPVDD